VTKQQVIVSVLFLVLFLVVFINAIAVVSVKQQSRELYTSIRSLQKQQDALSINWSRLQIQNSTLTNAAYVEKVARQQLGMQSVSHPQYVVLR